MTTFWIDIHIYFDTIQSTDKSMIQPVQTRRNVTNFDTIHTLQGQVPGVNIFFVTGNGKISSLYHNHLESTV